MQKALRTARGSGQDESYSTRYSEQSSFKSCLMGVFWVIFIFSKCSLTLWVGSPLRR